MNYYLAWPYSKAIDGAGLYISLNKFNVKLILVIIPIYKDNGQPILGFK